MPLDENFRVVEETIDRYQGFEYGSLIVQYDVSLGRYWIRENIAWLDLGYLVCEEGPGWVFYAIDDGYGLFMADNMAHISEMMNALNAELT